MLTVGDEQEDKSFVFYQVEDGLFVGVILRRRVWEDCLGVTGWDAGAVLYHWRRQQRWLLRLACYEDHEWRLISVLLRSKASCFALVGFGCSLLPLLTVFLLCMFLSDCKSICSGRVCSDVGRLVCQWVRKDPNLGSFPEAMVHQLLSCSHYLLFIFVLTELWSRFKGKNETQNRSSNMIMERLVSARFTMTVLQGEWTVWKQVNKIDRAEPYH